jgi:integrase
VRLRQRTQEQPESDWKKIGPCLYRYRNGTYYALIKHRGKQFRRSLETRDLAYARRKLTDVRRDIEETDPELARRTLEDHSTNFFETLTGAKSTLYNVRHSIELMLADWPEDSPRLLNKIREGDCKKWIAKYGDFAVSTVNTRISAARNFFDLAVSDGAIARSPMVRIKYRRRPDLTRLTPTREEFDTIVGDLRSQSANGHGADDTADFVALSGFLGLGQAELSGIERQHINLNQGTIEVFRRKTRQSFKIPIYPEARPIIQRRLAAMSLEPRSTLLPHGNCKKGLAAACKRIGLPNFEPRSLRRFFISSALLAGVDVATVASWQGHKDRGALILKTYNDTAAWAGGLR